ncbi:MAG: hypothetical protein R3175_07510 [Marinobacter sp.]|uniref:hypothetical protein n=1 Tax=Marinobacter sp. TaxID=50741 RepID=UPI00299EB4D0|nr:hypothetical protein [Marinobacter sp.]MDX1755887.1 hypothetical protein [Marinobacter sp.]
MFKLNPQRTYSYPVNITVFDGDQEHQGQFTAKFKVLPTSATKEQLAPDTRLLDLVLVGAKDVEVPGPDGKPLEGDALLDALKDDPAASLALITAYQESISKKNRPRT